MCMYKCALLCNVCIIWSRTVSVLNVHRALYHKYFDWMCFELHDYAGPAVRDRVVRDRVVSGETTPRKKPRLLSVCSTTRLDGSYSGNTSDQLWHSCSGRRRGILVWSWFMLYGYDRTAAYVYTQTCQPLRNEDGVWFPRRSPVTKICANVAQICIQKKY